MTLLSMVWRTTQEAAMKVAAEISSYGSKLITVKSLI